MNTEQQFLPCPFCGETEIHLLQGQTRKWVVAYCTECEAQCGEVRKDMRSDHFTVNDYRNAAEVWNQRAGTPAADAGIDREG